MDIASYQIYSKLAADRQSIVLLFPDLPEYIIELATTYAANKDVRVYISNDYSSGPPSLIKDDRIPATPLNKMFFSMHSIKKDLDLIFTITVIVLDADAEAGNYTWSVASRLNYESI